MQLGIKLGRNPYRHCVTRIITRAAGGRGIAIIRVNTRNASSSSMWPSERSDAMRSSSSEFELMRVRPMPRGMPGKAVKDEYVRSCLPIGGLGNLIYGAIGG